MDLTLGERSIIFFLISRRSDIPIKLYQIMGRHLAQSITCYSANTFCYMHQGLIYLQQEIARKRPMEDAAKKQPIPIFSFINQLIASLREYSHVDMQISWADYLLYQKKQQYLSLMLVSWTAHSKVSLECQLLSALLLAKDKKKVQIYLRLRKYIIQLANIDMLDEIVLKHEDLITIVHRMFPTNIKKEIIAGIKKIFISFKIADAKIYASVFIEYILSVYDSVEEGEQSLMAGEQTKITSNIAISNFSSIGNFSSNLHKENGLVQKVEHPDKVVSHAYTIIQTKFIPKKKETQKSNFHTEEAESYDYSSSSLNFKDSNHFSIENSKVNEKENINQNTHTSKKSRSGKEIRIDQGAKQIKIEESEYLEERSVQHQSSNSNLHTSFDKLISRNRQFKDRMLSGESHVQSRLNMKEQDSINETINIIHNSIVRHRNPRN